MKKLYVMPTTELIKVQLSSNFASSFGGQIGGGSGVIIPNSYFDQENYENN